MLSVTAGIILVSNSTIKIPARTGFKGNPWLHHHFVDICQHQKLRMPFLLIDVTISFRWYILPKATLIVSSRGTVVNKDFMSNDIILNLVSYELWLCHKTFPDMTLIYG